MSLTPDAALEDGAFFIHLKVCFSFFLFRTKKVSSSWLYRWQNPGFEAHAWSLMTGLVQDPIHGAEVPGFPLLLLSEAKEMGSLWLAKLMWLIQSHWTHWRRMKKQKRSLSESHVYPGAGCRVWYFRVFSPHFLCYLSSPFVHHVWCLMLSLALCLSAVGWSELHVFSQRYLLVRENNFQVLWRTLEVYG